MGAGPANHAIRAFTVLELLVVIAVIGVLVALAAPCLSRARAAARQAREAAGGQQLALAYALYADDHAGALLIGHPTAAEVTGPMVVRDWTGARITGELARRYPWRLAPYLEFNLGGLYQSGAQVDELRRRDPGGFTYLVSLFPSLGLNIEFLGGSDIDGHAFNPQVLSLYGRYYLKRLDEAGRPAELVSFVSARAPEGVRPPDVPDSVGYFRLRPPNLFGPLWSQYGAGGAAAETGFVAFRHGGRAVSAHLDGHVDALSYEELLDMRRWSSRADGPGYTVEPRH